LQQLSFILFLFFISPLIRAQDVFPPINANIKTETFTLWQQSFNQKQQTISQLVTDTGQRWAPPFYLNGLINEASPYLLKHAINPINWQIWEQSVLESAQEKQQLIFISVGYSTCHWCHVMEKESFNDLAVATSLNSAFTSIKVDRELNPDLDQFLSHTLELVKGSAGWPITAVLTPQGDPIWIESYISKDKLLKTLNRLNLLWKKRPATLKQIAKNLNQQMKTQALDEPERWSDKVPAKLLNNHISQLDQKHGGKAGAPKFPDASLLQLLLYGYQLQPSISAKQQLDLVLNSLMTGGIRDHVNGGFHRYATDSAWEQPHFEKMLYNQALLISVFSKAYQVFNKEVYQEVVEDTFLFLEEKFKNKEGGYYSATDADHNGQEGEYYLFSPDELSLIPQQYKMQFNWNPFEGSHFRLPVLRTDGIPTLMARKALLTVKAKLKSPYIDKKIITSWNALLVSAYLDAYISFKDDKYLKAAIALSTTLQSAPDKDYNLFRASFQGALAGKAMLDDYAYMSSAMIKLYRITQQTAYLSSALNYYKKGSELFGKNYRGELANTNALLTDGELISPHVELANAGIWLQHLGKRVNKQLKPQISAIKKAMMNNSGNSYAANQLLLALKNSHFHTLQSFAKGNGRVSFTIQKNKTLVFNISLGAGWHINSMTPIQKDLIATKLVAPQGKLFNIQYPQPVVKMMRFNKSYLSLFEDRFKIQADYSGNSASGEVVELSLQACNHTMCLLPEKLSFFVPANPII
jgi:uncharacterized protein YyaL (SSP411 family)